MKKKVQVLLVYPETPVTYWSYKYAIPFLGRKSAFPPLGLLTVAALLPRAEFDTRLIDLNVQPLTRDAVAASDLVMISAMIVHRESVDEITALCQELGTPVAAGGPFFTSGWQNIKNNAPIPFSCSRRPASIWHTTKNFWTSWFRPDSIWSFSALRHRWRSRCARRKKGRIPRAI